MRNLSTQPLAQVGLFVCFLLCISSWTGAQETDPLVAAYQKEFVFLDNEIRLLQQRIEEVRQDGDRRVATAGAELRRLESELLALNRAVDRRNDELRVVEEEQSSTRDATETIDSIIAQATSRLERYGVPPYSEAKPDDAPDQPSQTEPTTVDELEYVFSQSLRLLDDLGDIRSETSPFFLEDGSQVEGTIVHIGRIASFGVSDSAGGTLAPAGGGRLRLVEPETEDAARMLADGRQPDVLPIFLYESLDSLVETGNGKGLRDTIEGGGIIGIVILAIGAVAVVLILLRAAILSVVGRRNKDTLASVLSRVQSGSLDQAETEAEQMPGAQGRVILATVRSLKSTPGKTEDVISEAVLHEQPKLERFRSAISVFAAVAPLLGLLGTVTGMISTFDVITQYGTGDPKLLSGGISEALITTELGLAVAIPTLLIGNLLASWSDRVTSDLEVSALRVLNAFTGFESSDVSA
jgi:biopolymer transport protein ExbB